MPYFPEERVTPDKTPLTFTGVDCFDPLTVKRGKSSVKRYGVLFTCMTVRAIHIEVAHNLATVAFTNALRRFMARQGSPKLLRSDNGGNVLGGEN